jgi:hypothetical protein
VTARFWLLPVVRLQMAVALRCLLANSVLQKEGIITPLLQSCRHGFCVQIAPMQPLVGSVGAHQVSPSSHTHTPSLILRG